MSKDSKMSKENKRLSKQTTIASTADDDSDSSFTPSTIGLVAALFPESKLLKADDDRPISEDSFTTAVSQTPLKCDHLMWKCLLTSPAGPVEVNALLNSGAHLVLIRSSLTSKLRLPFQLLNKPECITVAISASDGPTAITHFVDIAPSSLGNDFSSRPLRALVVPKLLMPLILGLPFLVLNRINCNYAKHECNVLINGEVLNLLKKATANKTDHAFQTRQILASIHEQAKTSQPDWNLEQLETEMRQQFHSVFEPLPHVNELLLEPIAQILLKDPNISVKTQNYPCPQKWKEAWHMLLQQHLEARCIQPSHAPLGCGAFIIPKADPVEICSYKIR